MDVPDVPEEYLARTITPVGIFSTTDGYFVLGRRASNHPSLAGIVLASGGPADLRDVIGNSVNLNLCLRREYGEELGIDIFDQNQVHDLKQISVYLSAKRPVLMVIYDGKLGLDKKQVRDLYEEHSKKQLEAKIAPELSEPVFIAANDKLALDDFINKNTVIDYFPSAVKLIEKS